jgi:hypothetical protein
LAAQNILWGEEVFFLRLSAKKNLFTPQNFFGGEAAVYSCKNCQRTFYYFVCYPTLFTELRTPLRFVLKKGPVGRIPFDFL